MEFSNKVVIVTGASRGIGFATATHLYDQGANVVFAVRNPKAIHLPKEIKYSDRATIVRLDVTSIGSIKKMVSNVIKRFGRIDILVNNAGVDQPCSLVDVTEKHLDYIMDTNFKGVVFCSKYVAEEMIKQKYGKIINLSSIAGKEGTLYHLAYVSSKHAVIGLTKCLARELIKYNINVNAVAPGLIETDMLRNYFNDFAKIEGIDSRAELNRMIELTPRGKMGTPKDVAELIAFLASDRAENIVGHTFGTDGGILQH